MRDSDGRVGKIVDGIATDPLGALVGGPVQEQTNGQSGRRRSGPGRKKPVASRRATREVVRRIDAWSVLKLSVVFYVALYGILLVAAVVLWMAATATGLRDNVESFIGEMIASNKFQFVGWELFRAGAVGGAILVVFGTGANVMLAVLYNLISDTVGGVVMVVEERPKRVPATEAATVPEPEPARILVPEAERRRPPRPRRTQQPEPSEL